MAAWSCAGRSGAARRAAAPQPTATTPSRPAGRKGRRKRGRGLCCSERAPQPPAGRGGGKANRAVKVQRNGDRESSRSREPFGGAAFPPPAPHPADRVTQTGRKQCELFFFFFLYTEYRKVSVKSKTLQLLCTVELAGLLGGGVAYKQKRQRGVTTNELLQ